MEVTAESLRERYRSMNTEALADLYHAGGLTDLADRVLKDEITSRGLDWAQFTKPPSIELESKPIGEQLLWTSKLEQASIDERHPAMADQNQPAEKDLVGIKGWLLFYTILRWLGAAVLLSMQWRVIPDVAERSAGIFVLTLILVGLYFLSVVRRPITRYYHIGLNCLWAALFAVFSILTPSLQQWLSFAESSIWAVYWIRSKRVWETYCQDAGTVANS